MLDALVGFIGAGAAEMLGDSWFRVEREALAAAVRIGGGELAKPVFDELVRFLVADGWLERRGDGEWRFTPRKLAERGPAPGPESPVQLRRPAPGGLRGLFDAEGGADEAVPPREAARRAARDRGLDADHRAVLAALAAAADPLDRVAEVTLKDLAAVAGVSVDRVRRIVRNLEAAGLIWRARPGGRGPVVSLYLVLCLKPKPRMPVDDWVASLGLRKVEAAVLRALAAREDPVRRVASVRLRRLARDLGCDRAAVAGSLRRMGERGHVRVLHRGGPGRNDATRIVLRVPAAGEGG